VIAYPGSGEVVGYDKIFLRPIIGLLEGKPKDVVERLTVKELTKHRRLVSEAHVAYLRVKEEAASAEISEAEEAYITSLVAMHAQLTVVSTLIDFLGYIPADPVKTAN
jgi:TraR antiactivator